MIASVPASACVRAREKPRGAPVPGGRDDHEDVPRPGLQGGLRQEQVPQGRRRAELLSFWLRLDSAAPA